MQAIQIHRPSHWLALLLLFATLRAISRPAFSAEPEGVDYRLAEGATRTVLPNGVIVIIKPERHADHVAIELMTRVGAAQEDNTTAGVATLIGHLLERRLSESDGKKDDLMSRTGSVASVNVTLDFTELSVVTERSHCAELLTRMTQAYSRRPFTETEVEVERKKMQKELENNQDDFTTIYDLFLQAFYRYHPYRQPLGGNAAAIRNMRAPRINAFVDRWYASNRTIVCIVGNVDSRAILDQLQTSLAALKPVQEKEEIVTWEAESVEKELQLSGGKQLAFIFLAYPAPSVGSSDFPAMRVLHSLMGEGVSSRLWLDLREERGLAYSLGSEYPVLEGPAHFLSFVVTPPRQLRVSRRRLFAQMERIRKEDVPEWELMNAKWKLIGSLLSEVETPKGKALHLASLEAQGVGYQFTDRFMHSVWRVTAADVRRVANHYLDNYTLIMARPIDINPFP